MLTWFWPRRVPDLNIGPLLFFPQKSNNTENVCSIIAYTLTHTHTVTIILQPSTMSLVHLTWPPAFLPLYCRLCFLLGHVPATCSPLSSLGRHPTFPVCLPQLRFNAYFYHVIPSPSVVSCLSSPKYATGYSCVWWALSNILSCLPLFKLFLLLWMEGREEGEKGGRESLTSYFQTQTHTHTHTVLHHARSCSNYKMWYKCGLLIGSSTLMIPLNTPLFSFSIFFLLLTSYIFSTYPSQHF